MANLNSTFHKMMDRKDEGLTENDLRDFEVEIEDLFEKVPPALDKLSDVLSKRYSRVYAVGVGNSLYAPESLKFFFRACSGIEIEVFEAHEFNAYYIDYMPKDSLVIVCSHGGAVARAVETAYLVRKRGATSLALTCKPGSRLIAASDHTLCYPPHNEKSYMWGNGGYEALALIYALTGIRIGQLNGRLQESEAREALKAVYDAAVIGYKTAVDNDALMREIMFGATDRDRFYFLGAGPSYIMTEYACAKFMEQAATDGIHQQIEEYGHEQYWVHNRHDDKAYVFLLCPEGKSVQRALEDLDEMNFLGLNTIVITTKGMAHRFREVATHIIESSEMVSENLFALVSCNILSRLANFRAMSIGNCGDRFASNAQYAEHYVTIHYSRFCEEVAEFDIPMPDKATIEAVGPQGLKF